MRVNLFGSKKESLANGTQYIVRSSIDPVSFKTRMEARQYKKLLKNSMRQIDGHIVKVVKTDGYVEEEKVS